MKEARPETRRIGLLIPSSNTVVEQEATRLIPQDGSVSLHFSRFQVTTISADSDSVRQFEQDGMLQAALLLADAEVDRIAWAGTAASWLGIGQDEAFVSEMEARCGIPTTTAVLAINKRLSQLGARRIGLVTPYIAALERQIVDNYKGMGIEVVASRRLNLTVNTEYADVDETQIEEMVRNVTEPKPDAIVIMCTNLRFGIEASQLELELCTPIIDSVAATIAACLGA